MISLSVSHTIRQRKNKSSDLILTEYKFDSLFVNLQNAPIQSVYLYMFSYIILDYLEISDKYVS